MSFILDALRKSESERRREATPGLAHLPPAVPRSHAPAWVWIVMSVLAVGLLGLTALWWWSTQTGAPSALDVPTAATQSPSPSASASGGSTELPTSGVARPNDPAGSSQIDSPVRAASLPTVAEVRASGIALPDLNLQLISYSEDASQRFVFINGFRYRQGQRVQNGPLIVSISADSVVLQQQGRDFLLTPQ